MAYSKRIVTPPETNSPATNINFAPICTSYNKEITKKRGKLMIATEINKSTVSENI